MSRRLSIVALVLLAAPALAASAEKSLGSFRDWTAVAFDTEGKRACMIFSQPKERSAGGGAREPGFVFVTHRPHENWVNKVSVETGYPLADGADLRITIGAREFALSSDRTSAWTAGEEEDRALIAAMRAGRTMVVEGNAEAGSRVRDSYSLLGFTAAYEAIGEACGID